MRYLSTRGRAAPVGFIEAMLTGLAPDGGLYMPESWPVFSPADLRALQDQPYHTVALRILRPFVGDDIPEADLARILEQAWADFDHPAICPLTQLDSDLWLLELFHGPTLAFKDIALQLLGRLLDHALAHRGQHLIVLGATSGDTGSAAIKACRDRRGIDIVILHPKGRVSEIQRRQMTTVSAANVHNLAVEGSFDDCQDIVKALFNDAPLRQQLALSAANSINWVRIVAQSVYYIYAATALGAPNRCVSFATPTGNFGNICAGWVAGRIGLPLNRLVVGSNRNDILTRFFRDNDMTARAVTPTLSPSMDIQISSNFERLLFEAANRDGPLVARTVQTFRETGAMPIAPALWRRACQQFNAFSVDDAETLATIRHVQRSTGQIIDPHTAVGVAAALQARRDGVAGPMVCLSTAHPAKFPQAIDDAIGVVPALPPRLGDLLHRPERVITVPASTAAVRDYLRRIVAKESLS